MHICRAMKGTENIYSEMLRSSEHPSNKQFVYWVPNLGSVVADRYSPCMCACIMVMKPCMCMCMQCENKPCVCVFYTCQYTNMKVRMMPMNMCIQYLFCT